jgi:hypothetical protein
MLNEFSLPKLFCLSTIYSSFRSVGKRFGNTYAKRFSPTSVNEVRVILGEQYFFRVNSIVIMILLEALDTEKTKIEVISSAGGTGWLTISYDAHGAFVRDVKKLPY